MTAAEVVHESLEARLAEVMGVLNAATAEIVALVAEALAADAWQVAGMRSPAHWVAWQCGISPARAATFVAMARSLVELPATRAAFGAGELTEDQTRVVCTHTDAAHDDQAAELARSASVPQLRRALRGTPTPVPEPTDPDDTTKPEPPGEVADRREVRFGVRDDGRWWCHAVLPGDEGAVVQRALQRARDAEFHLRHPDTNPHRPADPGVPGPADITWVDALLRLAHAGLGDLDPGNSRPAERYQVILHVDTDAPAASHLHLAGPVPASVRRSLTCDCTIRVALEHAGQVVALSRRQATADHKTRLLVEDRDGGCVVHGCAQTRWLHIHHLTHREDGGATTLDNLVALCPTHHRQHHTGLLHITGDPTRPDSLTVTDSHGRDLTPPKPRPPDRPPHDAARHLGLEPQPYTHPSGEQLHEHWITWTNPPGDGPPR